MKFEYEKPVVDTREPIAILYYFNGGPKECLAVKAGYGQLAWFYSDGQSMIGPNDWGSESQEIKRFYHGDTITITF